MKNINIYLVLLPLMFVLINCQNQTGVKVPAEITSIPVGQLLDRNQLIQMSNEWNQVQNNYVALREKLNKNPNDHQAALELVLLFTQEARVTGEHGHYYPAAMDVLDQILSNSNNLSEDHYFVALNMKAGVLMSLHQFEMALETAKEAIEINPFNAQIYGVLVDANVELGNYEEAVHSADKMVSIRPDLRSYARVSYLRQIFGDVSGAIDAMEMAVTAGYPPYEETAWAGYQLGKLYELENATESAKNIYQQILLDRPGYPFAIAALANLKSQDLKKKEALQLLDKAIAAIPEVSFYTDKARILYESDEREKADKVMREVFLMLEDDRKNGHNMDLFYAEIYSDILNNQDKALEHALKEYKVRPKNIEVNKLLALIYSKKGDIKKTQKHLKLALRTNIQDSDLMALRKQIESVES